MKFTVLEMSYSGLYVFHLHLSIFVISSTCDMIAKLRTWPVRVYVKQETKQNKTNETNGSHTHNNWGEPHTSETDACMCMSGTTDHNYTEYLNWTNGYEIYTC